MFVKCDCWHWLICKREETFSLFSRCKHLLVDVLLCLTWVFYLQIIARHWQFFKSVNLFLFLNFIITIYRDFLGFITLYIFLWYELQYDKQAICLFLSIWQLNHVTLFVKMEIIFFGCDKWHFYKWVLFKLKKLSKNLHFRCCFSYMIWILTKHPKAILLTWKIFLQ